ncbi:uncharacterized protein, partial [Sinocyclocheilus grahami]|uniref:uncharacterized protein n=1 Tax=Sinocyclocheilus grahami TaxID=75366 RepID=UPI0007ACBEC7
DDEETDVRRPRRSSAEDRRKRRRRKQNINMSTNHTTVIVAHNPPRRRRPSKDLPPDMRIVLLGSSVSENSLVGNFILGRAAFDSEAPPDVVERVGGRLKDRHLIIINSPQLLQTNISDHQLIQTVRECVFLSDPGPHVIVLLLKHEPCSAEDQERVEKTAELNEETQSVIERFGGRHHFFGPKIQVSTLMENIEQMLEENRGEWEWELIHNGSPFTICESEEEVSTPATTTSPTPAMPEPSEEQEPKPEPQIFPKLKPTTSDLLCEPATSPVPMA